MPTGKLERCRRYLLPAFTSSLGTMIALPPPSQPHYHRVPDRGKRFISVESKMCPTVPLGNELRKRMSMGPRTSSTAWGQSQGNQKAILGLDHSLYHTANSQTGYTHTSHAPTPATPTDLAQAQSPV